MLDVLADFVNTQGVAGVAHDSLGFVAGFQLCLAVGSEDCGLRSANVPWPPVGWPAYPPTPPQAGQAFNQQRGDLISAALGTCVHDLGTRTAG